MKKILLAFGLAFMPIAAQAQFCPSCIQNSAAPQTAQINIGTATIRGSLTVSTETVTNLYVTNFTAANFIGGGVNITNLNASNLTSGTVPSGVVTGAYTGITQVGTLTAGTWDATPVGVQYGGTGQNFITVSTGSIIYFSADGVMSTLAPSTPESLLQTNGSAAPIWTSSPSVSGINLYGIPLTALDAGTLPTSIQVSSGSISYVNGASVVGNISGSAGSYGGTVLLTQLSTGTLPTSVVASSITATGVPSGTYGTFANVGQFTVGTDGRLTNAANVVIALNASQVTLGTFPTTVILPQVDLATGTLPSAVVASSITNTGVSAGTYGNGQQTPQITVTADGRVTNVVNIQTAIQVSTGNIVPGFNGAAELVQLNGSGFLPALNGSLLTNITATSISTGSLPTNVLISTANVTPGFNGINEFVQLTSLGYLPILNGSLLTNLTAANLSPGGLPNSVTISTANVVPGFNGANELVQLNGSGFLPALNGSLLTNVVSSATLAGGALGSIPVQVFASSTTFLPNLGASGLIIGNGAGVLPSTGTLLGTANQVIVTQTRAPELLTLSLPQSIASVSTPTFSSLDVNNSFYLGTGTVISTFTPSGFMTGFSTFTANAMNNIIALSGGPSTTTWTYSFLNPTDYSGAPTLSLYDNDHLNTGLLYLDLVDEPGGMRMYLWPHGVQNITNLLASGIPPTFGVFGDVVLGDIYALGLASYQIGLRYVPGTPYTQTTNLWSAYNVSAQDTDFGATINLAPLENGGGPNVNHSDGYLSFNAYGIDGGSLANGFRFQWRNGVGTYGTAMTLTPAQGLAVSTAAVVGAAAITNGDLFEVGGGTFAVTTSGHFITAGQAPTTTSCNSQSVTAGSNYFRGGVGFAGGSQSTCTINFSDTGGLTTPMCTCADATHATAVQCAPGAGTLTMALASPSNDQLYYHCAW